MRADVVQISGRDEDADTGREGPAVRSVHGGGVRVLHPLGDLDGSTAGALRDAVDAVLAARDEGVTAVVVAHGRRLPLYPDLDHAVGTASAETLLDELRAKVRDHERARATLPVIEQAKGVLMGRFGLDAEEAFTVLRTLSQEHNTEVRDLADRLVAGSSGTDGASRETVRARAVAVTQERLGLVER